MLCVPAVEDAVNNLTSAEAHNYFSKAISGKLQISVDPPVQPKGGSRWDVQPKGGSVYLQPWA